MTEAATAFCTSITRLCSLMASATELPSTSSVLDAILLTASVSGRSAVAWTTASTAFACSILRAFTVLQLRERGAEICRLLDDCGRVLDRETGANDRHGRTLKPKMALYNT